ncbi:hypothetical protein ABZ135_31210 [Streptomyces sp. NPDC006339]|uniref:hypothetical protein n=1 Tax=Streptomyces sp. NPDC006339 TaxID=3156755 RepID=UPI0033A0B00A
MSHTFTRPRAARAARCFTGILLAAALIGAIITINAAPPSAWWPQTGQAFAATPNPPQAGPRQDPVSEEPCALIVGPAHDYCLQATQDTPTTNAAAARPSCLAVWPIALLAAAIGLLLVLRRGRTR